MRFALGLTLVASLSVISAVPAHGQTNHMAAPASALSWAPAPPFLPPGARFAVLQGDPGQAGVYTIRLEFPPGYVIKPHFHPTDEHVTVLSGTFVVGMGDVVDTQHAQALTAGGFITAPANGHHFAVTRVKTVVQVHGEGPFAITYVNPADDPRRTTAARP